MKITSWAPQRPKFNSYAFIRSLRGFHQVEAVRGSARIEKTFTSMKAAKAWLREWFDMGNIKQLDY